MQTKTPILHPLQVRAASAMKRTKTCTIVVMAMTKKFLRIVFLRLGTSEDAGSFLSAPVGGPEIAAPNHRILERQVETERAAKKNITLIEKPY